MLKCLAYWGLCAFAGIGTRVFDSLGILVIAVVLAVYVGLNLRKLPDMGEDNG